MEERILRGGDEGKSALCGCSLEREKKMRMCIEVLHGTWLTPVGFA